MKTFTIPNIIPAGNVLNANLTSAPTPVFLTISCAIQVVFTGVPTGTFAIQASCDPAAAASATGSQAAVYNPTNWTTVTGSSQAVTAAGDLMWNLQDIGYNWIRLVYTDTSGGTSTAIITDATLSAKAI